MSAACPSASTVTGPQRLELVRRFWAAYQARDWTEAQGLLASEAHCTWWTGEERFVGAEAVVNVNAVYPEGWAIRVLALEPLSDGRVLSLVRVDHGEASHYGHSWFGFTLAEPLRIAAIAEFWATTEPPPAWRDGLPGRERTGGPCISQPL